MQATITSKGQITIPKNIRLSMGLEEGDHVEFKISQTNDIKISKVENSASIAGILGKYSNIDAPTDQDFQNAIMRGMSREE